MFILKKIVTISIFVSRLCHHPYQHLYDKDDVSSWPTIHLEIMQKIHGSIWVGKMYLHLITIL